MTSCQSPGNLLKMSCLIEEFEPIFGKAKVDSSGLDPTRLNPFLFYVHAPDSFHLRILVTDFRSTTWEAALSVMQLEDMRDNVGVGGSWSEFVEYLLASLKSQDVKLFLEGQADSIDPKSAKLVAQKSRGMPRITFSLMQLVASAATDATAKLSLELFRSLKHLQDSFIQGNGQSIELEKVKRCQKERSEAVLPESKRMKLEKMSSIDEADASSMQNQTTPDKQRAKDVHSVKAKRVLPLRRRAKTRGAVLQDNEEEEEDR